ncbi:hypothetical protein JW897_12170 [Chromobacterium alkanivorans]|uniref:hypothetical protein n=1 Tax=Chromobacterium alkanivorans TaxID=1071719 RepID=UPI001968786F|nr:hypothetical protein [Chromobacterium alkanivorans]MBN3004491.1 hypothetical protein [Chromobacterium alkanivorans]
MNHRTVLRAEVVADIYAGPNCDQVKNLFRAHADGDMDESIDSADIVLKCKELPPGTIIEVRYPACPACGLARLDTLDASKKIIGHASKCECSFDWDKWAQDKYS